MKVSHIRKFILWLCRKQVSVRSVLKSLKIRGIHPERGKHEIVWLMRNGRAEVSAGKIVRVFPDKRFVRIVPSWMQKRDDDGKKLCLVCDKRLPKYRRSYCSDECWVKNTPGLIRVHVERRDNGVCAECKTQCRVPRDYSQENMARPTWEADHIVPVCKGGGLCGIEGYRTLCLPCHKKNTAKLVRKNA
jgi:hypothetical protein